MFIKINILDMKKILMIEKRYILPKHSNSFFIKIFIIKNKKNSLSAERLISTVGASCQQKRKNNLIADEISNMSQLRCSNVKHYNLLLTYRNYVAKKFISIIDCRISFLFSHFFSANIRIISAFADTKKIIWKC